MNQPILKLRELETLRAAEIGREVGKLIAEMGMVAGSRIAVEIEAHGAGRGCVRKRVFVLKG